MSSAPTEQDICNAILTLERFVALMYDRTSNCLDINTCRRELFVKKGRSMEALPPTYEALLQHTYRVTYQAGYVWAQALQCEQHLPPAGDWSWKRPVHTSLVRHSRSSNSYQRTNKVWLYSREGMQRKMQVLKSGAAVYTIMQMVNVNGTSGT